MPSGFDIILAGGGTAACVIAGRLAAADPSLKILVVEMGQHSHDVPIHIQPCQFVHNLAPNTTTMSLYTARPDENLNGRSLIVPCGRCVGGGSAVNFMAYVRSAASDYDGWAKLGNQGWSSNDLLPLMKKMETYMPKEGLSTHGYSGPMQISNSKLELGLGRQFLDITKKYDPHRPQVDDNNDLNTGNAYSRWPKFVDPRTGRRCDAASVYLYPHSRNPNVQILVGMRVKRVIIENGRAVGIEYANVGAGSNGELFIAKASKLVVLSAGAFGSPSILERSGVGAKSLLEKHEIPVVMDLPGVGENYQDHIGNFVGFNSADLETMDDVWSDPQNVSTYLEEWESSGTGKIAHNGFEAMAKLRPTAAEVISMGSSFQSRWDSFFKPHQDKPLAIITPIAGWPARHALPAGTGNILTMCYYILYPESIGNVHITSRDDADAPLDFDPQFFSKSNDIASLTYLYKKARELGRRMPSYRGEVPALHPQFPPSSAAACREAEEPVPINAPDIVYSTEDDLAIVEFHRNILQTTWHSLGTCAMKPLDKGGVVDARLNVYGVKGLKVADMSICPTNVGNNTYTTALLIGEKAAMVIGEDLGINMTSLKTYPWGSRPMISQVKQKAVL